MDSWSRRSRTVLYVLLGVLLCGLWPALVWAQVEMAAPGRDPADKDDTFEWVLTHGPFRYGDLPNAVVHDPRPAQARRSAELDLVVYLHGFHGCARAIVASVPTDCGPGHRGVPGGGLGAVHSAVRAAASGDTVLVVPQLRLLARDGAPGRFYLEGGFRAFLEELCDAMAPHWGADAFARVRRITLVAHSAGYKAAAAILRAGDLSDRVQDVVLLDALYAAPGAFFDWLIGGPAGGGGGGKRRLLSLHGASGKPALHSVALGRRLRRRRLEVATLSADQVSEGGAEPFPPFRYATAQVPTKHAAIPVVHLAAILTALHASR